MSDKIDKIIENLNHLKQNNLKKEQELTLILQKFENEKKKIESLSQSLANNLNLIVGDLSSICEAKKGFIEKIKINKREEFYEEKSHRIFFVRESILTELFKNDSYKTLYNISFSIMVLLLGNFIFREYLQNEQIFEFKLLMNWLRGYDALLYYSFYMYFCAISFILLVQIYRKIFPKLFNELIVLFFFTSFFVSFLSFFLYLGRYMGLSFVTRFIYYFELIRISAKVFSYFCEKFFFLTYKILNKNAIYNSSSNIIINARNGTIDFKFIDKINIKRELLNFTFFFYAPTLIYRDIYPRISVRNYSLICIHLLNFLSANFFSFLVFKVMLIPYFDKTSTLIEKDRIIQTLVSVIIGSNVNMLILFFGVAHSWNNFWAEILRFADKSFYKSFWTATTPSNYYAYLIHIAHEFFDYVFKPYYRVYLGEKLTNIIELIIFGLMLDFGLYYSLGFFCPVLTLSIIFAKLLSFPMEFIKHRSILLINLLLTTLGFGIFFLIELGGLHIQISDQIPKNERFLFWKNHIIFFN